MNKNKVMFGLENIHYFPDVSIDSKTGELTHGEAKKIPGARNISLSASGDLLKWPADNIFYYVASSNEGYEGDLEAALLPDHFRQSCLGEKVDEKGIAYEVSDAENKAFALTFEIDGDKHKRRHVLYNVVASRPDIQGETVDGPKEPNPETIPIVAAPLALKDMKLVKASSSPADGEVYEKWNETLYIPTAKEEVETP